MQNFLELIWLLHVIVCAVFLGFKTEKSKLACYYLNECHAEFSGTNLVTACYCICCFFLGFKTENPSCLVIT